MKLVHRWQPAAVAACAALLTWSAGALGQDATKPEWKPGGPQMERKALDTALYNTLRDVINRGADLYNPPNGDWNGCYRLYEGALMSVRPLLNPDLQKTIDGGLAAARTSPSLDRRAFELRAVIDRVRDAVNPNPKAVKPVPPPVAKSLWDRLGGEAAVKKVVDDTFKLAAADPKVDLFRGKPAPDAEKVAAIKKGVVDFVHDATKSPDDKTVYYHGKNMKAAHKGMHITNAQFDAFAADLKKALADNGVKAEDADALLKIAGSTRKDIVEGPKPPPPMAKSLWDRLGGAAGVKKVVDDTFAIAAADKKVDLFRGMPPPPADKIASIKKGVVDFIHDATKSPDDKTKYYKGKGMKEVHKGMHITEAQFDAFAADLKKALADNGVKAEDADALLKIAASTRKDIVEGAKPPPKEKKEPEKEKPAKEKPAKEKPATEKPAKEKPAKEKPAKEKAPAKEKGGIDL